MISSPSCAAEQSGSGKLRGIRSDERLLEFSPHFYSRLFTGAQTLPCNSIKIDCVEASGTPERRFQKLYFGGDNLQ
jgi:hypothetical protein